MNSTNGEMELENEDIEATVYPSLGYLTLDEALETCKWLTSPIYDDEVLLFNGKLLFPFLRNNCSHCAVLLDQKQRKFSPVIDVQDELDLLLMYESLTSMMMTLAEYCSSGAYYIGEVDDDMYEAKGFLCPNEEKMLPIFQKYNPGVPLVR